MDKTRTQLNKDLKGSKIDVINQYTGEKWYYSDIVKEHFFKPRNILLEEPRECEYDATGMVGSPACGDMMNMWMKIDPKTERIVDLKWKTFGCGSAIAATSMYSVMLTENGGLTIAEVLKIRPQHITDKDIEEAVLEGAQSLGEVQKKLKVGVGMSPEIITEIEQLVRFYVEKYYG